MTERTIETPNVTFHALEEGVGALVLCLLLGKRQELGRGFGFQVL